jgi:hypothetical protein
VGEQHGVVASGVGDSVAVGAGEPGDQAVGAQPPEVVTDLTGGDLAGLGAEQVGELAAVHP